MNARETAMECFNTLACQPNHANRQEIALQGWNALYESNALLDAHQDATARIVSDPGNAEFWRRLAGSLRKASGMI